MKEYRPVIVDSVVLNILNHRILTSTDFVVETIGGPPPEEELIYAV